MKKLVIVTIMMYTLASSALAQVIVAPAKPISKTTRVLAIAPKPETILLEDILESLCPQTLTRGDREFDGHGPKIKCRIELTLKNGNTEIWAKINFEAKETQQDWSTATGIFNVKVYTTPYGKKITKIISDKFSRTEYVSPPAGFQLIVPGQDVRGPLNTFFDGQAIAGAVLAAHGLPFDAAPAAAAKLISSYMKDNTVTVLPSIEGRLVKFFHIVGDTGGDDISNDNNCKEDTRIEKIEFFPVSVFMTDVK